MSSNINGTFLGANNEFIGLETIGFSEEGKSQGFSMFYGVGSAPEIIKHEEQYYASTIHGHIKERFKVLGAESVMVSGTGPVYTSTVFFESTL